MQWIRYGLVLSVLTASVVVTQGGIFGRGRPQKQTSDRVAQLIVQAQTESNYYKRATAISQLREFDATKYPEIIPVLVQTLRGDQAITVRIEAARSLGRIRPLTPMAKSALSHASLRDPAFRVRWQARTSLMYFTVVGLNPNNHAQSTGEDPKVVISSPSGGKGKSETAPPSEVLVPPKGPGNYPRPLPKGPVIPVQPKTGEPPLAPLMAPPGPVGPLNKITPVPQPATPTAPATDPNSQQGNRKTVVREAPPVLLAPPD